MANVEQRVETRIENGEWVLKPSPWVKEYIKHLAAAHDLTEEEVLAKCFLEGVALAFVEEQGKFKIMKVDDTVHTSQRVKVFGKNGNGH